MSLLSTLGLWTLSLTILHVKRKIRKVLWGLLLLALVAEVRSDLARYFLVDDGSGGGGGDKQADRDKL